MRFSFVITAGGETLAAQAQDVGVKVFNITAGK